MNHDEAITSGRVLFWMSLGPFLLLLTLLISLIKAAPPTLFMPLAAICGLPVCLRWRMNGLLPALITLGVFLALGSLQTGPEHRFWLVGMAMAVALSFVVAALSAEEADSLISQVTKSAQSRLDNLWRLDEKLKNIRERWQYDREDFQVRLKLLTQELEDTKSQLERLQETSAIAHHEIQAQSEQMRKLQGHLLELQQEGDQLHHDLSEKNLEEKVRTDVHKLQDAVREDKADAELEAELGRYRGLYTQLRGQFEERKEVIHLTRKELHETQTELETLQRRFDESTKQNFQPAFLQLSQQLEDKEEEILELESLVSELIAE